MKNKFVAFIIILSIAVLYIIISVYIGNFELLNHTLLGKYPALYKYKIVTGIYSGIPYSHTILQLISIITIALLTGINIYLISKRINGLRNNGKLHLVIGGSMLLGLATGGCAVCGIPLLAFIGITGGAALLPFEGNEFSFLSILLLSISLIMLIKNYKPKICKINYKKTI